MKKITIGSIFAIVIEAVCAYYIYHYDDIYNIYSMTLITISLCLMILGMIKSNKIQILSYSLALITLLLVRNKTDSGISDGSYIIDWLSKIFTSKIVFINIMGNLVLYMPLYLLLNEEERMKKIPVTWNLFLIKLFPIIGLLLIIVSAELLQYILKVGVFDIIDIILNIIGVLIISVLSEVFRWKRNQKKQEKKKDKKNNKN